MKYLPVKRKHFYPQGNRRASLIQNFSLLSYIFFLAALIFTFNFLKTSFPGILGFASDIRIEDLLGVTNQKRVQNGTGELRLDSTLSKAAYQKALDMFADDYWAHIAPDGRKPWDFIKEEGYDYIYAGENLAKDFNRSQSVVEAWLNSSSHRENLLNPRYEDIGLAVVDGVLGGYETTLVVQMFGKRKVPVAVASVEAKEMPKEVEKPVALSGSSLEVESRKFGGGLAFKSPASSFKLQAPPLIDIPSASKSISVLLGTFLVGLFALDSWVVTKKGYLRLEGHTLAHLALLIMALFGIWYANAGVIL